MQAHFWTPEEFCVEAVGFIKRGEKKLLEQEKQFSCAKYLFPEGIP